MKHFDICETNQISEVKFYFLVCAKYYKNHFKFQIFFVNS